MTVLKAHFGWAPVEADVYTNALTELKNAVKLLNTHLGNDHQFLVSDHLTIADLVVSFALLLPFQVALDGGFRKAMGSISRLSR